MYEILLQDLFAAYFQARKGKRNTHGQLAFEMDVERNLVELAGQIHERRYKPSPCSAFVVDDPAPREIFAPIFRDRVVHHLLHNYYQRVLGHLFIADNYAGIKGRGTLYGIGRLEHHIRSCTLNHSRPAWVLKMDIRSYFLSIDKHILFELLQRLLDTHAPRQRRKDEYGKPLPEVDLDLVRYLSCEIIFADPTQGCRRLSPPESWRIVPKSKSMFCLPPDVGLPVGSLVSQFLANLYLTPFDEFCKRELGARHYGRYVDDFYFVHEDHYTLRTFIKRVDAFLWGELRLHIHPNKVYLQESHKGVDFLGAYVKPYRRYTNRRATGRFKKTLWELNRALEGRTPRPDELKAMRTRINSYLGHLQHFDEYRMKATMIGKCVNISSNGRFDARYHKFILPDVTTKDEKNTPAAGDPLDGGRLPT